jgi:hypothetical protein
VLVVGVLLVVFVVGAPDGIIGLAAKMRAKWRGAGRAARSAA